MSYKRPKEKEEKNNNNGKKSIQALKSVREHGKLPLV